MQKERVLVTGASGFIGSNLLDYLLEKDSLYTTNFTEPLSYQDSAFLKLPKFP